MVSLGRRLGTLLASKMAYERIINQPTRKDMSGWSFSCLGMKLINWEKYIKEGNKKEILPSNSRARTYHTLNLSPIELGFIWNPKPNYLGPEK